MQPFVRTRVGDIQVTSLLDGISRVSDQHFPAASEARVAALRQAAGFEPGLMPLPFNCYHFELAGRQYLVDVGNNRSINPLTGNLFEVLPQAGIDPTARWRKDLPERRDRRGSDRARVLGR